MKKVFIKALTVGVLFSLFLSACQNDNESNPDITSFDIESEAAFEATFEEVDLVSEAGMETLNEIPGARITRDEIIECAEVTKDTVNQVITIDFGDGCEGPHGVIKSGKIIIEYEGRMKNPGSFRQVTFEDFFVDSVQVEGVRKVTNITESSSTDNSRSFEIVLTGGKITFPSGAFATRDASYVRTSYFHEDRRDNYATLDGAASGANLAGNEYQITILETLIFKRGCRVGRVIIPVDGIKEIVVGDRMALIDYGDGDCDNRTQVTTEGATLTRVIRPRGFGRFLR